LKEEALDRTMWRARFGRGFGPVVRQTINEGMNESLLYCSNSYTSLHFKTLKSQNKTLKIGPYMFLSPLKPSAVGPLPYFATLLNWNVDLHLLKRLSVCGCMSVHSVI
jgi:hypothetical protein